MKTATELKNLVKETYGTIAKKNTECCCSSGCCGDPAEDKLSPDYSALDGYYEGADLGLGCGIPTQYAGIKKGDTVLDLGSGAGNDVFVARAVTGDSGRVIGVDMTEEMIIKANQNLAKLGFSNVEFRAGEIENLPVNSGEVDVVISNCVLNLVPDKSKAFQEIYRALKPGGHFCISDIVLNGELPEKIKSVAEMYAGCIAGALQRGDYLNKIKEAGFTSVEIKKDEQVTLTNSVLSGSLGKEDIRLYRESGTGVFSITVTGRK